MTETPLSGSVLVTGATGFMGRHLCERLLGRGVDVHAIARAPEGALEGVHWHTGDLTNDASLRAAVSASEPSVVFHLAAYGTTFEADDRATCFDVNVHGALKLWDALDGVDCRLVALGSCGEYGRHLGPVSEETVCEPTWFYPATKHAAVSLLTSLARESGRELAVVRPFGPYGPGDTSRRIVPLVVQKLVAGESVDVTGGEQLRDFAFIDDHIDAMLLAATTPLRSTGRIYNIGSGTCVSLKEMITTIANAVSDDAIARVSFGAVPYRDSEVWEMCADIGRAREELGYAPRVALEDGVRRTVRWHRETLSVR